MKKIVLMLLMPVILYGQTPVIDGDLLLCPNGSGTASVVNQVEYDTYQWFYKYWFNDGPFEPIPGANSSSFTYDWLTYDQAQLKVITTLNGETFESNIIQIDSYAFLPITTGFELSENISIDPEDGDVLLCEGTSFIVQVLLPYTIAQWYRDGILIPGATSMQYEVTGPGVYHVEAAPAECPQNVSSSQGLPIIVVWDPDCDLSTPDFARVGNFFYPNPASSFIMLDEQVSRVEIFTLTGQKVQVLQSGQRVDVSPLHRGIYLISFDDNRPAQKLMIE